MRSLVLLLHRALLGASATGPYLFFRPSSGHLYLSGQARELPIYRSVQRYQHSLEISVAQPFLFPPTHFFGLRNLHRACMLNLGYHWTGYLFYRLKKSSRHKVRTAHFTHAYRLTAYRITLSALASTFGGIVRPICFAVLRLMTSSNFVGCSTGRSAGFVPFRILSTYVAARWYKAVKLAP